MSRRKRAIERKVLPDPLYKSEVVTKLINCVMQNGKKSTAERIVYDVMKRLEERFKHNPLDLVVKAIETIEPSVEVKSRRVGGATYPIPVEVRPFRRRSLAMRWMIEAARKRAAKAMNLNLAAEIGDILEGRGGALKKRDEVHRTAEANKAFAHFRF